MQCHTQLSIKVANIFDNNVLFVQMRMNFVGPIM